MRSVRFLLLAVLIIGFAIFSFSNQNNITKIPGKEIQEDPITQVLIGLIVILLGAKIGGYLSERIGQPIVLGELIVGVIIGNLALLTGWQGFVFLRFNEHIEVLAELGIIIFLFEVGLEENIENMRKVGISSFLVAAIGVVFPFLLGYLCSKILLPGKLSSVYIFIGATLTATSVGITARVLRDLKRINTIEGRIILGAAVIDDILGLMILAIVTGIVTSGAVNLTDIGFITLKASLFLVGAIVLGVILAPKILKLAQLLWVEGIMLISALLFAFLLSYLANKVGLATIVGAFAAGLILEEAHFKGFKKATYTINDMIRPLSSFLVPIFFVLMGIQVRLETFKELHIIGFSLALTIVAIIGKQLCGLGAIGKNLDRISIGVGMIPRGEVGLIFAAIGRKLIIPGTNIHVIDSGTYSAVVMMVILTTFLTPPTLKYTLLRKEKRNLKS
jgi:Kef-type K+ transport system membrane component KefB